MLPIKGIEKTSFVDFPPYTVSTLFLGGCNFRCPFCHNPDLIVPNGISIPEEQILDFLESRKKWIDGICITGGEPLLNEDILSFIGKAKKMGLLVKLDTNGSRPDLVRKALDLVDYFAMDIKNSRERYEETIRAKADLEKIDLSIQIIKGSKDYEFRTTVVPGFHTPEDMESIGRWIHGAKRYAIQGFRSSVRLFDKELMGKAGFKREELEAFREIMQKHSENVVIRA